MMYELLKLYNIKIKTIKDARLVYRLWLLNNSKIASTAILQLRQVCSSLYEDKYLSVTSFNILALRTAEIRGKPIVTPSEFAKLLSDYSKDIGILGGLK